MKYKVIEDNGGGLHLYVFSGRRCIWAHTGYEYSPGNLTADLDSLENGADPYKVVPGDEYAMYHARISGNKTMISLLKQYEASNSR